MRFSERPFFGDFFRLVRVRSSEHLQFSGAIENAGNEKGVSEKLAQIVRILRHIGEKYLDKGGNVHWGWQIWHFADCCQPKCLYGRYLRENAPIMEYRVTALLTVSFLRQVKRDLMEHQLLLFVSVAEAMQRCAQSEQIRVCFSLMNDSWAIWFA